ncbi:uncharacterized protein [Eurosta solidaginis]|uniref:uncharacterized protein isoform X1 n=1 Tax=Eurosta solidaginis TaxID=178769 RepID=UPI0035312257
MSTSAQSQPICRTCFDTTDKTFYSFTGELVKDEERKTIANFLRDIAKLDNNTGISKQLPQQICGNCLRKLKVAFSFVAQVKKVNKEMLKVLRSKNKNISFVSEDESTDKEDINSQINDNKDDGQDHNDPISVPRFKHHKQCKSGGCVKECTNNSILCGNECHTEMKSILHKMMNLQYQINARIKFDGSVSNTEKKIAKSELKKQQQCFDKNGKLVDVNSIKSWFPIRTVQQANQVERKIESGFTDEVVAFLEKIFSFREASVDDVLRYIFDDDLGEQFNLEGRSGKLSLISYNSILHCVRSIFPHLPTDVFLKMIRTYVLRCHNRNKHKKKKDRNQNFKPEPEEASEEEAEIDEITINEIDEVAKSEPVFSEVMSEDSMMLDDQMAEQMVDDEIDDETKSDTYSVTNEEEYLEEVVVHDQFNSNAGDIVCNTLKELPEKGNTEEDEVKIETKTDNNISSMFPISTKEKANQIERNLKNARYAKKISEFIKEMKLAHKGDVDKVLRCLFTDNLITGYNLDGRKGKCSLLDLKLVSRLFNTFPELSSQEFLNSARRYVAMSHNRHNNKKHHAKKYDVFSY